MEHDHSVLRHSPGTFDADYGVAFCWAENIVGQQTQACKFKIVQESAPERLRNCKADNITWEVKSKGRNQTCATHRTVRSCGLWCVGAMPAQGCFELLVELSSKKKSAGNVLSFFLKPRYTSSLVFFP